eukprot:933568-Rhodomonas_salina.2
MSDAEAFSACNADPHLVEHDGLAAHVQESGTHTACVSAGHRATAVCGMRVWLRSAPGHIPAPGTLRTLPAQYLLRDPPTIPATVCAYTYNRLSGSYAKLPRAREP